MLDVPEVDIVGFTPIREPSARRLHGDRYVTGAVRFLDDEGAEGTLTVAILRSPHAHARIDRMCCDQARSLPGVHAVLAGADTAALLGRLTCSVPAMLTGTEGPVTLPCLPIEYVRYVGEPVAVIVADDPIAAERAKRAIQVDYAPLAPMLSIAAACSPEARRQHPDLPTNVLAGGVVAQGDARSAIAAAAHQLRGRVSIGRSSAVPLEPRGCIASWDEANARLIVRAALQMPHIFRAEVAQLLAMAEEDIVVHAPALGGAFGFKFAGFAEEPLTCLLAHHLRRAVRWVESREEALLVGAREYDCAFEIGCDADGRITGLTVDLDANIGALCATPGPLMPFVAACTFPGPYDVSDFTVNWRAVMTNKGPWNGARGYGKEATCLVLETALDAVARHVGADPAEIRRRNLLRRDQFPHRTATMTVDSGDYEAALDKVLALADYQRRRAAVASQATTVSTGIGVAFELTPEGIDPGGTLSRGFETATVRLDTSGRATVLTGVTSPGTGSETAIAQLVGAQLGIAHDQVRVVQGDTDRTPYGSGSFSSRAVLAGGTAAWLAAGELKGSLTSAAAVLLGAAPGDIELADGVCRIAGTDRSVPISAAIRTFRSLGGALPGLGVPQMEATRTYGPGNLQAIPDAAGRLQMYPTYSYSAHVAEVEVDMETGACRLTALSAVHDCGTVINQELVDAQLHGAIAMGAGLALMEEERYDPVGMPLAQSFKRYPIPRVTELPRFEVGHLATPSPFTALGTKGAGESGVGGAAAAIASAVADAIGDGAGLHVQLPLTPPRVLDRIIAAGARD